MITSQIKFQLELKYGIDRDIMVSVFEDGENGTLCSDN